MYVHTQPYLTDHWFNCLTSQSTHSGTEEVGSCCEAHRLTVNCIVEYYIIQFHQYGY